MITIERTKKDAYSCNSCNYATYHADTKHRRGYELRFTKNNYTTIITLCRHCKHSLLSHS